MPAPRAPAFDPKVLASLARLDLKARYVMEGHLLGAHSSPFHGANVEFSEYREYQPGDDLRHLDWRLLARSDRMYIKKYEHETNAQVHFVVDTSGSMGYRGAASWGSKLEVARVTASALAWLALRQKDGIGLVDLEAPGAFPTLVRPASRPSQLGLVLGGLQGLVSQGGERLGELLGHVGRLAPRRGIVVIFSDFLEPAPSIAEGLRRLGHQGHDVLAARVLDRDELEFPFDEGGLFEDLETGAQRVVDPGALRARYLERFAAFMDEHVRQFNAMEVNHVLLRTDRPPWPALEAFLDERARRR